MELLESCKKLIEEHVKKQLDPTSMEIMQYVVLGLYLTVGEVAKEKLPKILDELTIYAEEKSVLDMSHEYLNNYQEDNSLQHCDACVTRSLAFEDDGTFIEEKRNLLISLIDDRDYFSIISSLIHEFIHLLRFGGVQQDGHKYRIKDGLAVSYYDTDTKRLRRKHQSMEEGVVQMYTNMALHNLYGVMKNKKSSSKVYKKFIEGYKKSNFADYYLETSLIETLCKNKRFQDYIESSFTSDKVPDPAIQYFNEVLGSSSAFIELGKYVETIRTKILNQEDVTSDLSKARTMVTTFMNKTRILK